MTSDPEMLAWVKGIHIDLTEFEPQIRQPKPYHFEANEQAKIALQLDRMLKTGVIEPTEIEQARFISNIFSRPKKDGSVRVILNLKKLNEGVEYHHFKMETLQHAIRLMTPGCYMASVDLKDAYYSIPISETDRAYLCFEWEGRVFRYTCLPNGLAEAPRKFTKLLKIPFSALRKRGHVNSSYIDDSALFGTSFDSCQRNVTDTVRLMDGLGFTVHPEKSVMLPTQILTYLGFILDSIFMTVTLTPEKANKIVWLCSQLSKLRECSIRQCAEVIGNLVAAEPGVEIAPLFYKRLEHAKVHALKQAKGNFEGRMEVTENMREDLQWWGDNIHTATRQLQRPPPSVEIFTDSSNFAWGATCDGEKTGGPWGDPEFSWHINKKELLAAMFGLKIYAAQVRGSHVRLHIDNTTAVAYVNAQGGRVPDLSDVAREMWLWARARDLWLSAVHIPGVQNVEADLASRTQYAVETEWSLNQAVFEQVEEQFGPFDIDLFASRLNNKCSKYYSWKPDPGAEKIDALAHIWPKTKHYAFPPFSIIGHILHKLALEGGDLTLVAPLWPTQTWFGPLIQLLVRTPALLPATPHLLHLPQDPSAQHPLYRKLHLAVFKISTNTSRQRDFLRRLPTLSCSHGDLQPLPSMGHTGNSGQTFVVQNKIVQCRRL